MTFYSLGGRRIRSPDGLLEVELPAAAAGEGAGHLTVSDAQHPGESCTAICLRVT